MKRPAPVEDAGPSPLWERPAMDVIVLALGLGFFALSAAYTLACDRL